MQRQRNLKLMSLNACLRLTHYLENSQTCPHSADLLPHLLTEAQSHRMDLQALEDDESEVAFWEERIPPQGPIGPLNKRLQPLDSYASCTCCSSCICTGMEELHQADFQKKGFMYRLSINPAVAFYVSENKTLAGREDRAYEWGGNRQTYGGDIL